MVRIHFPPADSQSLSRSRFSRSRTPLFRAGLGSWLGDRVSWCRYLVVAGIFNEAHPIPSPYLSSHTSSKRQPLYWLLVIIVSPLTSGCQQVAARRW
jgi:hypothetical protein